MDEEQKTAIKHGVFLLIGIVMSFVAWEGASVVEAVSHVMNLHPEEVEEPIDSHRIDGYNIVITEIEGDSIGLNYDMIDDTIYISKDLSITETKEICEHELLHERGIEEKHHDFIYSNQDQIDSEVCLKLIYEMGRAEAEKK